jgi:hypothetical protein
MPRLARLHALAPKLTGFRTAELTRIKSKSPSMTPACPIQAA